MPVLEADYDDFTLTLYNLNYVANYLAETNGVEDGTQGGTQGGTQENIQTQIFDMIKENEKISTSDIAIKLGISVRTVKRRIKQMPNVSYIGSGYSGHWEIEK